MTSLPPLCFWLSCCDFLLMSAIVSHRTDLYWIMCERGSCSTWCICCICVCVFQYYVVLKKILRLLNKLTLFFSFPLRFPALRMPSPLVPVNKPPNLPMVVRQMSQSAPLRVMEVVRERMKSAPLQPSRSMKRCKECWPNCERLQMLCLVRSVLSEGLSLLIQMLISLH